MTIGNPEKDRDEYGCDMPHCSNNFDITDEKRVATVRNGEVIAFCAKHCEQLLQKGINLKTLKEAKNELPSYEELQRELIRKQHKREQQDFIHTLWCEGK